MFITGKKWERSKKLIRIKIPANKKIFKTYTDQQSDTYIDQQLYS